VDTPSSIRDKPVVFFIGSDFRRKGLDVLVDALALTSHPKALRVAGVDERNFESAFPGKVAKARASGSSIEFLGLVERARIKSLMWDSDIFCLPSRAEALGVALLEALAAGLPCVATRVGGIPEIADVIPGITLVSPDDPVELAKGIESAILNRKQANASAILNQYFGHRAMVEKIRKIYLEM
jgi:glycosyltransferase involved in cell wall biosynthesis